jgi:hypothetical protein
MGFLLFLEETVLSLNGIKQLIFEMEKTCIFFEMGNAFLNSLIL